MSRFVRTLRVEAVPASYYGEDSAEIELSHQGYGNMPYPVAGVGPLILATFAIVFFLIIRPHVNSDPVRYQASSAISAGTTGNLVAADGAIELDVPEVESAASELASSAGISSLFTPEVQYWADDILKWSQIYEVDPNVVATIMQIESCGDPRAASYAGAQGLFQVMPFHFAPGEDMLDPDTNAMRGMAFYKEQMRFTGGDRALSFAGYNGGYAASGGDYANWPAETQRYFYWAKGIYDAASSGATSSTTLDEWLAAGGAGGCQRAAVYLGI